MQASFYHIDIFQSHHPLSRWQEIIITHACAHFLETPILLNIIFTRLEILKINTPALPYCGFQFYLMRAAGDISGTATLRILKIPDTISVSERLIPPFVEGKLQEKSIPLARGRDAKFRALVYSSDACINSILHSAFLAARVPQSR
jgi:hypothetical protein